MSRALDMVSVHFAKAGGTSLARALADHYGERVFWDHTHDPCNPAQNAFEPPDPPAHAVAVHGHIRGDLYSDFDVRLLVTFLREPVDKMISQYFFWKNLPPSDNPEHLKFLAEKPSILELARKDAGVAYPAYFGGMDMRDFDFIGFHDRRGEDLASLSAIAGFPIPSDIHLNAAPPSEEQRQMKADTALHAELRRIMEPDVDFYENVRSLRLGRTTA